jgi:hypothetical protein
VLVHLEDGSETFEPLTVMAKANPLTPALRAKAHDLLDAPGWKSLDRIAAQEVKLTWMVKQAKLLQARHGPNDKLGILVPKDQKDALAIDAASGKAQWKISMDAEVKQADEHDTFQDLGKGRPPPCDHQKI